jgi:hypothetical protein
MDHNVVDEGSVNVEDNAALLLEGIDVDEQIELLQRCEKRQFDERSDGIVARLEESYVEEARLMRRAGNKQVATLESKIRRLKHENPDCIRLRGIKREQTILRRDLKALGKPPGRRSRHHHQDVLEEECPVCMDSLQDMRINPGGCGHLLCSACAAQVSDCPLCRAYITERVSLF